MLNPYTAAAILAYLGAEQVIRHGYKYVLVAVGGATLGYYAGRRRRKRRRR